MRIRCFTLYIFGYSYKKLNFRCAKGSKLMKSFKHKHGTPNKIILQEEKYILLSVDRALSSSSNSQIIGRNGEVPLIDFLTRYLPSTLKAVTGHFITPSGKISPQLDIIIVDSRYPFLSENEDKSVLVMLHSVIWTVEVKTNLRSNDIKQTWKNSIEIMNLAKEIEFYGDIEKISSISTNLIAYRCAQKLDTIQDAYEKYGQPLMAGLDLYLMRFPQKEMPKDIEVGGLLHFEPPYEDENETGPIDGYWPCFGASHTPLSDFYYRLVQDCYYTLGNRDFSFNEIGAHFMNYMSWSTMSWDSFYNNSK